jgi:hypothetical protein
LRSTIIGIINLLSKREEHDVSSQADILFDGSLMAAIEWQLNKWIVEDRDRLKGFKAEITKYHNLANCFGSSLNGVGNVRF